METSLSLNMANDAHLGSFVSCLVHHLLLLRLLGCCDGNPLCAEKCGVVNVSKRVCMLAYFVCCPAKENHVH